MYNIGEIIVYGATGVCQVEAIGKLTLAGFPADVDYYTLQPLSDNHREVIYVPLSTNVFMRKAVTRRQAEGYIALVPEIQPIEPQGRNPKAISDFYSRLFGSYDIKNLLAVIVSLVIKKREAAQKGKRLNQTQMTYLKRAQELVYNEFSIALNCPRSEVEERIESLIDRDKLPLQNAGK